MAHGRNRTATPRSCCRWVWWGSSRLVSATKLVARNRVSVFVNSMCFGAIRAHALDCGQRRDHINRSGTTDDVEAGKEILIKRARGESRLIEPRPRYASGRPPERAECSLHGRGAKGMETARSLRPCRQQGSKPRILSTRVKCVEERHQAQCRHLVEAKKQKWAVCRPGLWHGAEGWSTIPERRRIQFACAFHQRAMRSRTSHAPSDDGRRDAFG